MRHFTALSGRGRLVQKARVAYGGVVLPWFSEGGPVLGFADVILLMLGPVIVGHTASRLLLGAVGFRPGAPLAVLGLVAGLGVAYFTFTWVAVFEPWLHVVGNLAAGLLLGVFTGWRASSAAGRGAPGADGR